MHIDMIIELSRLRSEELIRETAEYRLARQARKTKPDLQATAAGAPRPTRMRLLAWLRG
ncbi:hypothetical protein QMK19_31085 [Streptomyces sp. H10-C2]|uniref:hypothetical protein n=1 Tax=unclassified Streptomyces TaxID=2593676 RepID=UPI0024B9D6F6|nr:MULTISPECIES: hypothetical protein [unclassified Streptomyces]MDJ0345063.1 hypothetical protein [Streptomyces sp. PH10-H1]MDJ0373968.1 hypothetical protein [Streptomyces sp. H10-C2]